MLASFIGPCRLPIKFFLPEEGISICCSNPLQSTTHCLISHLVLGKWLLHSFFLSLLLQCSRTTYSCFFSSQMCT